MTSHGAVARIRRITGIRQVGHAGTLDPDAVGVLPIAVGRYTRLLPYTQLTPKVYFARAMVGSITHTGDQAGRIVACSANYVPAEAEIARTGQWLVGDVWQVPPQVSALKTQGVRHYQAVHQNQVVWPSPRRVHIASIDAIDRKDRGWEFLSTVGPGTYIRAVVRDWGYLMGLAAHLIFLERRQVGGWVGDRTVTLEQLDQLGDHWPDALDGWEGHLNLESIDVDSQLKSSIGHGDVRALAGLPSYPGGVKALTYQGELLAVVEGPPWHYRIVLEEGDTHDNIRS